MNKLTWEELNKRADYLNELGEKFDAKREKLDLGIQLDISDSTMRARNENYELDCEITERYV